MKYLSGSLILCFLLISCSDNSVRDANGGAEIPGTTCGNGQLDKGEVCDGNLLNGRTCASLGEGYTGTMKCLDDCSDYDSSDCVPPTIPSSCGNGEIDEGEACDGDLHNGQNCATLGVGYTGLIRCLEDCSAFDTSDCVPPDHLPSCGNGQLDEGELCDGTLVRQDQQYNCHSIFGPGSTGELKCAEDCLSFDKSACTPPLNCGDGRIQINEQCDTAYTNEANIKCSAYYGDDFEGLRSCNSMCRWDLTPCVVPDHCGNGRLDSDLGEECDPSAPQSYDKTCEELRGPGSKGSVYCNNMCKYSLAGCSISSACGNGQTDNGTSERPAYHEVCDTTDLKGKSCASLGSGYSGELGCLVNCSGFDYSDCKAPDA